MPNVLGCSIIGSGKVRIWNMNLLKVVKDKNKDNLNVTWLENYVRAEYNEKMVRNRPNERLKTGVFGFTDGELFLCAD